MVHELHLIVSKTLWALRKFDNQNISSRCWRFSIFGSMVERVFCQVVLLRENKHRIRIEPHCASGPCLSGSWTSFFESSKHMKASEA